MTFELPSLRDYIGINTERINNSRRFKKISYCSTMYTFVREILKLI